MGWEVEVKQERRLCKVDNQYGYFHTWEHYSKPIEASPFVGGHPGGMLSMVYGIVEFDNDIRRINPIDIHFCDEEHEILNTMNEKLKKETTDI